VHVARKSLTRMKKNMRTNLFLDERSQGQVVEEVSEALPHVGVAVFARAFIIEAVHCANYDCQNVAKRQGSKRTLCDLSALVVAAQNGDAISVANLPNTLRIRWCRRKSTNLECDEE